MVHFQHLDIISVDYSAHISAIPFDVCRTNVPANYYLSNSSRLKHARISAREFSRRMAAAAHSRAAQRSALLRSTVQVSARASERADNRNPRANGAGAIYQLDTNAIINDDLWRRSPRIRAGTMNVAISVGDATVRARWPPRRVPAVVAQVNFVDS